VFRSRCRVRDSVLFEAISVMGREVVLTGSDLLALESGKGLDGV